MLIHRAMRGSSLGAVLLLTACVSCSGGGGGSAPAPPPPPVASPPSAPPASTTPITGAQHHADMMSKLGLSSLLPARSPDENEPNGANYDESVANPYPDLPDPLVSDSGQSISNAQDWNTVRRDEILEHFEREIYGRVPASAPQLSWRVESTETSTLQGQSVLIRDVVATPNAPVDGIDVEIRMSLVTPTGQASPPPVLVMLGPDTTTPPAVPDSHGDLPRQHLLIENGWGYAMLSTDSIQPDNADGLSRGVIGYAAEGGYRDPEDWGALRAWAWGSSQALTYLRSLNDIDPDRIGIEGVSRYGKAALVAMAFDERFSAGLIASSGKGGATLLRRDFGESVTNLANPGAFHWMAGNFLKYADAAPDGLNPGDLPVDSHQLIALCAPRPVFVSIGIPEQGDSLWLDHFGTFKATLAANPVYELLGTTGLSPMPTDTAELPPVNTSLTDGPLAWRQHDGGHTDRPNIAPFTAWAEGQL